MTETVIGVSAGLESTLTTIYTAVNPSFIIEINVCADISDCNWSLYVVEADGVADFTNRIFNTESLSAASRIPYSCTIALNPGDMVQAAASVADNVGIRLTVVDFEA